VLKCIVLGGSCRVAQGCSAMKRSVGTHPKN